MAAAVLFRGYAHRPIAQIRPWGTDWRKCLVSHREKLLDPLREMFGGIHVFLASYVTPLQDEIEKDYQPLTSHWVTQDTQVGRALAGLRLIQEQQDHNHCPYDLIVVLRFDLQLLKTPFLEPNFRPDAINFLWREWNQKSWDNHNRVPDALHMLPGVHLAGFLEGIKATPSTICLHTIYRPVAARIGEKNINILIREGFTDSNTDVMPNPFYSIVRAR